MDINGLTLKEKISQMFIVGFNGKNFESDRFFMTLLNLKLGGVIFFTQNIESEKQFKELIINLSKTAKIPMFYSIDQEGGRVERTEKIHNGKKYLSAKSAFEMGLTFLQDQTKEIALELKNYGINMNFAPVADVNTNEFNPIIGERAFSNKTEEVISAIKVVIKEYEKYGIITVGKHFPGHGAAGADSHKTMPIIDLPETELKEKHIKPFEEAIKLNIPAIMAAHVLYPDLDSEYPASISSKILNGILRNELKYKGLIITDDMEMNGIKNYTAYEACITAINAGVNMFIFRNANNNIIELIEELETAVKNNIISEEKINGSVRKIIELKCRYGIIN